MHCHINSHLMVSLLSRRKYSSRELIRSLQSGMVVAFVELQNEFPSYPPALSSPPTS